MTKPVATSIDKKIDFLSGYQIVGGLIGIFLTLYWFYNADEVKSAFYLLIILQLLMYLFSFTCGVLLFKGNNYAIRLSLINQMLQIVGFSCLGYGFEYVAGASFDVFIGYTDGITCTSGFGLSNWHLLINNDTGIKEISINFIAVSFVWYILKLKSKLKLENSDSEIAAIGT